jgi:outer membrane protein TolC
VAQYRPTLAFQGSGSYSFARYDTQTGTQSTGSAAGGLVLSVPIFEPNIAPSIDASEELVANAQGTADQARQDAREEAARSVEACALDESYLQHARKAAEGAAAVLTIVQARYTQGLSSPLDLIDAETAESTARVAKTNAEFQYKLAIVRVLVATGRKVEEVS